MTLGGEENSSLSRGGFVFLGKSQRKADQRSTGEKNETPRIAPGLVLCLAGKA